MADSDPVPGDSPKREYVVKITNVPSQIDESSLETVMGHFGKVLSCKILMGERAVDPATAWVIYKKESELESALKADGKLECGGCKLKITRAEGSVPSGSTQTKRKLTESSTCQDSCWFCLSNDQCETHMISYVSKHCYVAVAKGALSDMHTLIVPIYHYPNLASAPLDVQMDVKRVMDAMFNLALERGMGAIAFERYVPMTMKVAMHTHVQIVAVPMQNALKTFHFVDRSEVFGEATRVTFEAEDPGFHRLATKAGNNTQYLYLEAVGKPQSSDDQLTYAKCLWVFDRSNAPKIPVHFGREIAISALSHRDLEAIRSLRACVEETNMKPELAAVDWHNCVATKEEENRCSRNITALLLKIKS